MCNLRSLAQRSNFGLLGYHDLCIWLGLGKPQVFKPFRGLPYLESAYFMAQTTIPDLTIIVPVYNAMAHLDGLVADVLQIPDVSCEVIFVDDGSTDGSADHIDALAKAHPHFKALHNAGNLGAGVARNTGFPHATGRYTLFFDVDDRLHGHEIAPAIKLLDQSGADLGMFGYEYEREAENAAMLDNDARIWFAALGDASSRTLTLEEAPALLGFTNYPWNKLMRTDFYQDCGLRFGSTKVNNDVLGHWFGLLYARKITLIHKVLCTHIVLADGGNLTNQRNALRMEMFTALHETYDLLCALPDRRQRYAHHFWTFTMALASWSRGRLADEYLEAFRAELQRLVSRINLSDYARIRRCRSERLAMSLKNVLIS